MAATCTDALPAASARWLWGCIWGGRTDAAAGRLDRRAIDAVLGSSPPPAPSAWPAGLTDREFDLLRLALTGLTKRQITGRLFLSPPTLDTHLRHVYGLLRREHRGGGCERDPARDPTGGSRERVSPRPLR